MTAILALDTSTDACSVALSLDSRTISRFEVIPRQHTQRLLPMVQEVMVEAGIGFDALDAIAFGRGPGSFAGIRIATGAAQGLSLANDTPLIGVSTLQAMASEVAPGLPSGERILVLLDARMDEVYYGLFEVVVSGVRPITSERVAAPTQIELPADTKTVHAVGSGLAYLDDFPAVVRSAMQSENTEVYPAAAAMLKIAQQELAAGKSFSADQAAPVYLREGSWKKRSEQ